MKSAKILTLLSLLFFYACSSDEEDFIVGTWNLFSLELDCQQEPELSQTINASNGCMSVEGEETCIRLTFDNDGTGSLDFTIDGNGELADFSYTMNASETEVEICLIDNVNECSTLVIRGEKLLIIDYEEGCGADYSFEKK